MPTDSVSADATEWSLQEQQRHWRAQSSSAPDLKCSKNIMLERTVSFVRGIRAQGKVPVDEPAPVPTSGDAEAKVWRDFQSALRIMGLAERCGTELCLTDDGRALAEDPEHFDLGALLIERVRYLGELLDLVAGGVGTVKEAHDALVERFHLDWRSEGNTRTRMTWLEVLGLVEWTDAYHLGPTELGRSTLSGAKLVSHEAVSYRPDDSATTIPEAPQEIEALIDRLRRSPSVIDERTTYNIWVPSPASDPSKINNLAEVVGKALTPIDKEQFLGFIANRFNLKRSSVDSMLPFMRAGGFVQEVRKGVYVATPAARAWIESENPVDFIRLLPCHLRYVGELIRTVDGGTQRSVVYKTGARYGMNKEKCRWIISFLIDADLIIETSWTGLEPTTTGRALVRSLPLADEPLERSSESGGAAQPDGAGVPDGVTLSALATDVNDLERLIAELLAGSKDPLATGQASGVAFEMCVERAFEMLGYSARRIAGAGDSDVLVQWRDVDGVLKVASVDAKSSSSGSISHTNVSDVALTAHAEKNGASFIAVVAPGFTGSTLRGMARTKGWTLLTAQELAAILRAGVALGLRPSETGVLFESPDGPSQLGELIEARQRELEVISLVIGRLKGESANDEAVSARDISLIERRSELAPSIDELISALSTLKALGNGAIWIETPSEEAKHETYVIGDVPSAANRLRALARALEKGLAGPMA